MLSAVGSYRARVAPSQGGGDEGALSLAAAAWSHAAGQPALSLPRRCRAGHHAR